MQSLWMLAAAFAFTLMSVCVKLGAALYTSAEMIMYRGVIGCVVLVCVMRVKGQSVRTGVHRLHLTRAGRRDLAVAELLRHDAPAAGMVSALAYLSVRALGRRGEPEHRVVFYFSLSPAWPAS